MPIPGVGNNPGGDNAFSGPMGQKEPAYGLGERMKLLSKIGVQPTPGVNAAKQSQRAASRSRRAAKPAVAEAPVPVPEQQPVANYDQQLSAFWNEIAATPGASQLAQQIAQQVNIA